MVTRKATFDINDPEFQKILAEMVAKTMAAEKAAAQEATKAADTGKADKLIVAAFAKAGYKDIVLLDRTKPVAGQLSTVSVLTYKLWLTQCGRKVRDGQKAVQIRGIPYALFHRDQTEVATVAERKAYHSKMQKAMERREAKKAEQATA